MSFQEIRQGAELIIIKKNESFIVRPGCTRLQVINPRYQQDICASIFYREQDATRRECFMLHQRQPLEPV